MGSQWALPAPCYFMPATCAQIRTEKMVRLGNSAVEIIIDMGIVSGVKVRPILTMIALLLVSKSWASRIHVVEPGEQLGRLVALYEVSSDDILLANPGLQQPLEPGQQVMIPESAPVAPPRATAVNHSPPPAIPVSAATVEVPRPAAPRSSVADAIALPASQGIRYNGRWTPPGESSTWNMDCSNTARWITRNTHNVELPRTASGQYEWLRQRKRLWRTKPNAATLRKVLKPGDLLFWEHTYRPVRKPPVTHVMVYMGTDASGRMQMAGSQGSRGVGTYTFNPAAKMGSYPFFLWFRREGKFVAYGRP